MKCTAFIIHKISVSGVVQQPIIGKIIAFNKAIIKCLLTHFLHIHHAYSRR